MKKSKNSFVVKCPICKTKRNIFRISGDNTKPFFCSVCNKKVTPKIKK